MTNFIERQFEKRSKLGGTHKQALDQHEMVLAIMMKEWIEKKKVWWFAYELMGHWKIAGDNYFMSYKASTRVSELAHEGKVASRKSEGKLHLYASNAVLSEAIHIY